MTVTDFRFDRHGPCESVDRDPIEATCRELGADELFHRADNDSILLGIQSRDVKTLGMRYSQTSSLTDGEILDPLVLTELSTVLVDDGARPGITAKQRLISACSEVLTLLFLRN